MCAQLLLAAGCSAALLILACAYSEEPGAVGPSTGAAPAADAGKHQGGPTLSAEQRGKMAAIPAGTYRPLYTGKVAQPEAVAPFLLDRYQVTDADFARFVQAVPHWEPGRPPSIQANASYLTHWRAASTNRARRTPVRNVSWFAARAYCRWLGKRLPTIAEWERAAMAADRARPHEGETALVKRVLEWYGQPNQERAVGSVYENIHGVHDLHGSVWEWTEDFNSVTIDPDGRAKGQSDRFCGGGGFNASNPRDYAAFMRQAFRGGLTAASTTHNLGFRCAADSR